MNALSIWPSQSVRDFLECCNWIGLPLPEEELQLDAGLCLPVMEFFQGMPWGGTLGTIDLIEHTHTPDVAVLTAVPTTPALERAAPAPPALELSDASDAWLSQPTQAFFEHCNWTGLPLPEAELQQDIGLSLPVNLFFQGIPWGESHQRHTVSTPLREDAIASQQIAIQPPISDEKNPVATTTETWLSLSVQEFFGEGNWQGKPGDIPLWCQDPANLGQSVQQFFQSLSWQGTPTVGGRPTFYPLSSANLSHSAQAMANNYTPTNLTDIF